MRETLVPFLRREAQGWIAGHDAALAQRIAAGIERFVDLACKSQQAFSVRRGSFGRLGHDERIVLIG